ncbi:MAG: hypothetical protein P4L53_09200 [Candidatus Obscuribacterales bacterium]|nr:hypothetical protein [Candidatus Obscuribacterales bacterium]
MTLTKTKNVQTVAREVVGKPIREAEAFITEAGFISRVVIVHGVGIPGAHEYNDKRVKLFVENDVVYDTRVG